jgi:O-antigen ligase
VGERRAAVPGEAARAEPRARLPFAFWLVLGLTLLACGYNGSVFGLNFSGLAWSIPVIVGGGVVLARSEDVRFPVRIWLPWVALVAVYQLVADAPNALQRSVMILSPLVTGMAVSAFRAREADLELLLAACKAGAAALVVFILFDTRVLATGVLPFTTGLAPTVMTGSLFCSVFAAAYAAGRPRFLLYWAVVALIPVVAVTRMGMVATAISLPFTFAPLKPLRRAVFILLIAAAGAMIFATERVQHKMFYSGTGRLEDVRFDNPEFATSGRAVFWDLMGKSIWQRPLLGHGANSSEKMLGSYIKGLTHPHNDWLRLTHDYGFLGAGVYAVTLLVQTGSLLRRARLARGAAAIVCHATASLFIVYALFMLSDNIILYSAFFGHLHFALAGLAYGAQVENLAVAAAPTFEPLPGPRPRSPVCAAP